MSRDEVTGRTQVFVHLGTPIAHAKAPAMFNAELRRRGLDAVLVPLDVAASGLAVALETLAGAPNVGGLLVTMPHKAAVVGRCDAIGREARFVGAANAVRFDPERRAACEMFDGIGLLGALDAAGVRLDDADVLLVGCGGAGSAIAGALTTRPIRSLTLHNRSGEAATALAARLEPRHADVRVAAGRPAAGDYQVAINATRLGMGPEDDEPFDLGGAVGCAVADIVTGDERSPLLRHADALGLATVDGAAMLRAQMAAILDFWTADA